MVVGQYNYRLCLKIVHPGLVNWTEAVKGYMLVRGLKNLLAIPNMGRRLAIEIETILLARKNE